LYNQLHFVQDVTLFVAVHSPTNRYCLINFSVTVQSSDNAFILEMWTVAGKIDIMSLEMWLWP